MADAGKVDCSLLLLLLGVTLRSKLQDGPRVLSAVFGDFEFDESPLHSDPNRPDFFHAACKLLFRPAPGKHDFAAKRVIITTIKSRTTGLIG